MPRVRCRAARRARRQGLRRARDAAAAGDRRQAARARQAQVPGRLACRERSRAGRARSSCSTRPTSTVCRSPRAGPATAAPSSRCRRCSRRIRTRAGATSACTGCRSATPGRRACTGRSTRTRRPTGATGAGRMEVAVSIGSDPDHGLRGLLPGAQARRRADGRGLPARQGCRGRAVQDRRPAGAGAGRDRARGLLRARRARRRGPLRRPHRLLHAGRAVSGAAADVHDDAPRRHLSEHPRRPAAGRGRLARQGHGTALPARPAHHAARARRLRPAGRRGLPQLLHRLDPQGLPGARAQGDARGLGHRPALAHEDGDRRRRVGRRPRLRRGGLAGRRERGSRPRRRAGARPARPARPRAVAAVARRQARSRRHEDVARRGLPARVARGRPHERGGARPGRRALGLVRDRRCRTRPRPRLRRPGGAADGAARSGPGRESLPRPARDPALRGRGLARARARPPPGSDRRHARRRARLGRPARRALSYARDHRLHLRARPQLERDRRRTASPRPRRRCWPAASAA